MPAGGPSPRDSTPIGSPRKQRPRGRGSPTSPSGAGRANASASRSPGWKAFCWFGHRPRWRFRMAPDSACSRRRFITRAKHGIRMITQRASRRPPVRAVVVPRDRPCAPVACETKAPRPVSERLRVLEASKARPHRQRGQPPPTMIIGSTTMTRYWISSVTGVLPSPPSPLVGWYNSSRSSDSSSSIIRSRFRNPRHSLDLQAAGRSPRAQLGCFLGFRLVGSRAERERSTRRSLLGGAPHLGADRRVGVRRYLLLLDRSPRLYGRARRRARGAPGVDPG